MAALLLVAKPKLPGEGGGVNTQSELSRRPKKEYAGPLMKVKARCRRDACPAIAVRDGWASAIRRLAVEPASSHGESPGSPPASFERGRPHPGTGSAAPEACPSGLVERELGERATQPLVGRILVRPPVPELAHVRRGNAQRHRQDLHATGVTRRVAGHGDDQVGALDDIRRWSARVTPGGDLLIHDSFSSVGVTGAIAVSLLTSSGWRYLGRSDSMTHYRKEHLGAGERVRNVGKQLASLPYFVRNLIIKALILAKLGKLTMPLFKHDPATWPH